MFLLFDFWSVQAKADDRTYYTWAYTPSFLLAREQGILVFTCGLLGHLHLAFCVFSHIQKNDSLLHSFF